MGCPSCKTRLLGLTIRDVAENTIETSSKNVLNPVELDYDRTMRELDLIGVVSLGRCSARSLQLSLRKDSHTKMGVKVDVTEHRGKASTRGVIPTPQGVNVGLTVVDDVAHENRLIRHGSVTACIKYYKCIPKSIKICTLHNFKKTL